MIANIAEVCETGDIEISRKVKAIKGVDSIVGTLPTSVLLHYINGIFVGLWDLYRYTFAHTCSKKKHENDLE